MAKIAPLSGFPEWLPAERLIELDVLDTVRRVFELHGFASLETRSVEPLEQMLRPEHFALATTEVFGPFQVRVEGRTGGKGAMCSLSFFWRGER